ncbi:MAG: hypothetical protein LC131_09410 [Anaerolineae bacterium]|nr:hypothetical protein [Promineifilum sp.]MCZ2114038.1 hypothetical protein [Anaerolineae bacterium]HNS39222.1 hypothetical protein [Promineifilum sp.]
MAAITLLDGSLKLSIFQEESDSEFEDNICLCFMEDCPEDEKIFKVDETSIYLTPEQAALIVLELNRVLGLYRGGSLPGSGKAQ